MATQQPAPEQSRARKGAVEGSQCLGATTGMRSLPDSTAPLRARLCSGAEKRFLLCLARHSLYVFFPRLAPRASINHSFPFLREALCRAAISANKILRIAGLVSCRVAFKPASCLYS